MSDDFFRKTTQTEIALQNIVRNLDPLRSLVADQSSLARLVNQNGKMLGSITNAQKAFEQIRGLPNIAELASQSSMTIARIPDIIRQFERPETGILRELQNSLAQPMALEILGRYSLKASAINQAINSMNTPWLNLQNQIGSISGLTELQGIGHIVENMPSYGDFVTSALRNDLGDWRGPLLFDPAKLLVQTNRTNFYFERGFDPNLTNFPVDAFSEGLELSGLYEPISTTKSDETEASFMRTNDAHDRLMRFEFQLRIFLDKEMTQAFGPDWVKHRIPSDMRESWLSKKKRDLATENQDRALISYADFTDYVTIITRKDNWNEVFGVFFIRKTSVQESFLRLFPVRICTMHARPITREDALYLLVEIKRMNKAMDLA